MVHIDDRRSKARDKDADRRKYPRIKDKDISVQFRGDGFDAITQSLDISASGIYCKVDKEIPLMTKLEIVLALPNRKKRGEINIINVEGVVVRGHPVVRDGKIQHYDVAIFFNFLTPEEREILIGYIHQKDK